MLSKKSQQQWQNQLRHIQSARIIAMISRYKTDSEEEYQSRCKVEQWEVPMIEVIVSGKLNVRK
jgi:ATP-dependent DNA helicase RecQ